MSTFHVDDAGHKLSWVPDLPDIRDLIFSPHALPKALKAIPNKVDLRQYVSGVEDQGALGSCTANAFASMIEVLDKRKIQVDVSRLFVYYNERAYINTVHEDTGAYIRDGIKTLAEHGWATEKQWPYLPEKFAVKPPPSVYKAAVKRRIKEYMRIVDLAGMKQCLAHGLPFTFGFSVYDNFYTIKADGIMAMPKGAMLGGHAILAVGYDDATQRFTILNSWGPEWGDKGYFYMPYQYAASSMLCDDFWMIKLL